jgi:acyl-CoA thioesterase FadM
MKGPDVYPFLRLFIGMRRARSQPPLGLFDTHVSHHVIWPWDLDPWNELNNGRTLTIFDLGRLPLAVRTGLAAALRAKGWGITVAGQTTRYRGRVRMFERIEMRSRCIGWDARFVYLEQSMWKDGACRNHMLIRKAVVSKGGIVDPAGIVTATGHAPDSPALPDWVQAWIASEAARPWPPSQ